MHCLFASGPDTLSLPAPAVNHYRVDSTVVLLGPATPLPEPGWELVRLESPDPIQIAAPAQLAGETGAARYTDPNAPTAAANGLGPIAAPCRAVLIPIRKSEAWWALNDAERRAYFHATQQHPHHTEVGAPYIRQIHRRLFHSHAQTPDYDFLTYFEFLPENEPAFRSLLAGLRDTTRNPEWSYVDREWEIWLTKLV